jgi:hypothetical protein
LEAIGVTAGELFVLARGCFCFACRGVSRTLVIEREWREEGVPFLMAFAFSALRWACAGFMDFSLGMTQSYKEWQSLSDFKSSSSDK